MSALLPVALDLRRLKLALIGNGPQAARRLDLLREAGAKDLRVFDTLPDLHALAGVQLVFIADIERGVAKAFAERVRASGALVNVEDVTEACDFQSAAVVRRGDLAVGIFTSGRSPMLARVLKDWLNRVLPADFARVVDGLARQRDRVRAQGGGRLVLEAAATRAVGRLAAPDFRVPLS